MAVSADPTDPNFGLETDQSSPNFGLPSEPPKQESVVGNALAGAGDVIKGFAKQFVPDLSLKNLASIAYGPVNAQIQGYNALKGVVDTAEQVREAENTAPFSRERFGAGFNVVGQLGLLALGAKAPKPLSEVAGFKPEVAPEAMPQTPEPTISETVPPITETIKPEEITNAVQEQSPSSVLPHPQEGVTETGGERVGVGHGVQGEAPAEARPQTQEVGATPETPPTVSETVPAGTVGARLTTQEGQIRIESAKQRMRDAINKDYENPRDRADAIDAARTSVEEEVASAHKEATLLQRSKEAGGIRQNPSTETVTPEPLNLGDTVTFTEPSIAYRNGEPVTIQNKRAGRITLVRPDGKIEVKGQDGGYRVLPPEELKPTSVPSASESTTASSQPKSEVPTETTTAQPLPQTPSEPPPVTPETPEAPKTGVSSERFTEQYGEDAPVPNTGRSAGELKAIGQTRLDNFQKTGAVQDDPYSVLTNLREGKVPVSKLADDVSLLRAEHQRLKNDAINAEGTPEWEAKSQASLDMAQAIKEVAHGPASDMMRSFQEYDAPRYDNVTDFDQALRERLGRESTSQERVKFKEMADDVTNTRNGAQEAINGAQKKLSKMPKMNFEDAYKSIHDQIAELTKDCVL